VVHCMAGSHIGPVGWLVRCRRPFLSLPLLDCRRPSATSRHLTWFTPALREAQAASPMDTHPRPSLAGGRRGPPLQDSVCRWLSALARTWQVGCGRCDCTRDYGRDRRRPAAANQNHTPSPRRVGVGTDPYRQLDPSMSTPGELRVTSSNCGGTVETGVVSPRDEKPFEKGHRSGGAAIRPPPRLSRSLGDYDAAPARLSMSSTQFSCTRALSGRIASPPTTISDFTTVMSVGSVSLVGSSGSSEG
jgi:hypothetical protein